MQHCTRSRIRARLRRLKRTSHEEGIETMQRDHGGQRDLRLQRCKRNVQRRALVINHARCSHLQQHRAVYPTDTKSFGRRGRRTAKHRAGSVRRPRRTPRRLPRSCWHHLRTTTRAASLGGENTRMRDGARRPLTPVGGATTPAQHGSVLMTKEVTRETHPYFGGVRGRT